MSQQHAAYMAVPNQPNVKPAFTVKKLNGTLPRRIHAFDKKENKIKSKVVEEDAGYLVQFAKGHSIRCRTLEHLRSVGANLTMVPLVDTETGEIRGTIPNDAAVSEDE